MSLTTQKSGELAMYRQSFEREYQTSLRVLKAYPPSQAQLKWTERSNTAIQTAWILVLSQMVVLPILSEPELKPPTNMPAPPADWNALVAAFEQAHAQAATAVNALADEAYLSSIVMPAGPKGATVTVRRADALWMMLSDTVHHRGQLSVYLRASGAKVPSIYGPSGDEPWA